MKKQLLIAICTLLTLNYLTAQLDCGCISDQELNTSRGDCNETLADTPTVNMNISP